QLDVPFADYYSGGLLWILPDKRKVGDKKKRPRDLLKRGNNTKLVRRCQAQETVGLREKTDLKTIAKFTQSGLISHLAHDKY
ncbi:MAG: hypothetical protein LBB79_01070, partial [Prevotellaceae bacterium]|nr:hypothetical protein [Prevotellaceae bacterium]